MRTLGLVLVAVTGLGVSGCSQVSSVFKKKPHYHTDDGTVVLTDSEASLRTTPQQPYQFADQSYDVEIYDGASQYMNSVSQYAGYGVDFYTSQPSYGIGSFTDPRETEFVKLNGTSQAADWQNCETRHYGYLYISEYDFRLDPGFEVCMRNKGYVLTTEAGTLSKTTLSAKTAGLRGVSQPRQYTQPTGYMRPDYARASDLNFMR